MTLLVFVNIGSGNSLLADGTKSLTEPVLSYQYGNVALT